MKYLVSREWVEGVWVFCEFETVKRQTQTIYNNTRSTD